MSDEQKLKKIKRVGRTATLFLENNGEISDDALASLLALEDIKSSSTSVGRDLTENFPKMIKSGEIHGYESEDAYENVVNYIKEKRRLNKLNGQRKGGINSLFNNDFQKDELGKFKGSKKVK